MGAVTIEEVLETVPGFHVSSANGFVPVYTIRGIFSPLSSHVLVMQDGISVNDPVNSGKLFSYTHLTPNISKIEIIRGPGSALYGAGAFSGVINIITKRGEELGGSEVGGLVGSFDTYGGWAQWGKKSDAFDIAFSAQGRTTHGQREIVESDAQSRLDKLFNTRASLAPGPINVPRDDIDLGFSLRYRDNVKLHVSAPRKRGASGRVKVPTWKGLTTHHYRVLRLWRSGQAVRTARHANKRGEAYTGYVIGRMGTQPLRAGIASKSRSGLVSVVTCVKPIRARR